MYSTGRLSKLQVLFCNSVQYLTLSFSAIPTALLLYLHRRHNQKRYLAAPVAIVEPHAVSCSPPVPPAPSSPAPPARSRPPPSPSLAASSSTTPPPSS